MIEEFYKNLSEKLGFSEIAFLKKDLAHGVIAVLGKINQEKFVLKIASEKNADMVRRFKNEKHLSDFLIKKFPKKDFLFTEVTQYASENGFVWLLRRYLEGRSLSEYLPGVPLTGYDIIPKIFFLNRHKIINNLLVQHDLLSKIEEVEIPADIRKNFKKRYQIDFSNEEIMLVQKIFDLDLSGQIDFYKKNKEAYLENYALQSCDLVPGNLLLLKGGGIVISDLEFIAFDNYLLDYSFLWLFLWRYPKWQKELISKIITTEGDQLNFHMNILRITLNAMIFKSTQSGKLQLLAEYKKHIWKKYLINSSISYDALINTRK